MLLVAEIIRRHSVQHISYATYDPQKIPMSEILKNPLIQCSKLVRWGFPPSMISHFLHISLHLHDSHLKEFDLYQISFSYSSKKDSYLLFQLWDAWHLLAIEGFQLETVRHLAHISEKELLGCTNILKGTHHNIYKVAGNFKQ